MPQGWLVLLAMVFGLLVGIGFTAVVVIAHRRGQRAVAVVSTSVPQGVDEVIDALESVGVVLDGSATVVKASSGALTFGLVWNQALVHRELLELVDQVRRTGETITLAADQVFKAIGQSFEAAPLHGSGNSIALERGRIKVDAEGRTSLAKVWAGGDCVADAREDLTVAAVAAGRDAAESMHRTLTSNGRA